MVNIGLLGCGAIGAEFAGAVCAGEVGEAKLVALFDVIDGMASDLAEQLPIPVPFFNSFEPFIATPGLRLVVECASPDAVRSYAKAIMSHGKELLLMSSGALTDSRLFQDLSDLASNKGLRLMVPSGALGGIDALKAARGQLEEVTLTTTKPPAGLQGAPGFKEWEKVDIKEAQVVFEGPALEAVKLFPANVNVAATLSLAGLGPEKTRVRVVADPQSPGNVHEVFARGDFGVMRFTMENRPHSRNPRTSYIAVLSALETLRNACTPGPRIGT